ncbi:competence protein CoiA-like family [Rossellomorea vietnamensis]|uniref:Competence protein CoiA-like family n=1 Tax=Rossellomorea vietnamensis TaxID=218284 RepID=A0A5D4M3P8_9BACI|nr:competence protein CoiA family protein [Rossellomorea vietnamensis]TYR96272.1 competence protein CoiA-like family [Rossellomorea vietnamensis]
MREALHVIDDEIFKLPYSASDEEVSNFKKLAKKELFKCPYCHALLIIKHGNQRGLYFSHQYSEACEESRKVENAEKRYIKQTQRETKLHKALVDIIVDELKIKKKIYSNLNFNLGYREKFDWKEYPDIHMKIGEKEYAISVLTDVNSSDDSNLSKRIVNRHNYFKKMGSEPVWFIEKKEQAVEKDKSSIILWNAELTIASKTKEDFKWDDLVKDEISDEMFFQYFNYPSSNNHIDIDIQSLFYIYNNEKNSIVVRVQHFLKDRLVKPFRAFLINEGYEIPFSEALGIEDGLILSNSKLEEEYRQEFLEKLNYKKKQLVENRRREEERERIRLEQLEEDRRREAEEREKRFKELMERKDSATTSTSLNYNELTRLLRKRIGMTQKEQMELWTRYMPNIGYKNSNVVWDIVVNHNCKNFGELKILLDTYK